MPDSNNIVGVKSYKNAWVTSGTPVMIVPACSRVYCEIFNETVGQVRVGNPSGVVSQNLGALLISGGYITDWFSSDDWWVFSWAGGSGSISAWWVEGL